jgi:hypothetical protein
MVPEYLRLADNDVKQKAISANTELVLLYILMSDIGKTNPN